MHIIGDKKTPEEFTIDYGQYFSSHDQERMHWKVARNLPWNSYSRKMLGYLIAVDGGCDYVRETDDDNKPLPDFFNAVPDKLEVRIPDSAELWVNPYSYFSSTDIWPRGLPLERVVAERRECTDDVITLPNIGILQGLANGSPDVDAIYRLTRSDVADFEFDDSKALLIPQGCYTPFNSQATVWNVELLPLMYLPSTCSFRMTDIWRSFVAIRLMRNTGYSLIFTKATMYQDRNEHNLLKDFESEVSGYLGNAKIVEELERLDFENAAVDLSSKLRIVYVKLVELGYFSSLELDILDDWLIDCSDLADRDKTK